MEEGHKSPLIEVGWVLAGEFEDTRGAVLAARDRVLARLRSQLPEFEWRMPLVQRRRLVLTPVVSPVTLLEAGASERDARGWDFALVVTDAELISHYVSYALGMPARALSAAVLSTVHLEPSRVEGLESADGEEHLIRRIERLVLHLFGHLNGLPHEEHPSSFMAKSGSGRGLDQMEHYSQEATELLRRGLRDVADLRLEEQLGTTRINPVLFHLRVARQNGGEVLRNVRQIAPWKFPLRLSRLTIAACSTLFILLITAESWDLGMNQPAPRVLGFAALALTLCSFFVLKRHRLLTLRPAARLTEQTAITHLSVWAAVQLGMLTTYALLFSLTLGAALFFYPPALVREWAASVPGPITLAHYVVFAGFAATLGILIGALGASFEREGYFRHVAFVDEET